MIWWKVLLVFLLFVSIVLAIVLPLTLKNKETGSAIPYSVPSISSYNAKVWPSIVSNSPLKISFPEFCPENNFGIRIPDVNKVSIALSGGAMCYSPK